MGSNKCQYNYDAQGQYSAICNGNAETHSYVVPSTPILDIHSRIMHITSDSTVSKPSISYNDILPLSTQTKNPIVLSEMGPLSMPIINNK